MSAVRRGRNRNRRANPELHGGLLVRDILDGQILSMDRRRIGRVADVEAEIGEDGRLRLTNLVIGPEALAGRISHRLQRLFHRALKGRFEQRVPVSEIEELGPTVRLRKLAERYDLDSGDDWVALHILRFIPGNGREHE
jgi:hypothetical protein